jgi:hypothetical protein
MPRPELPLTYRMVFRARSGFLLAGAVLAIVGIFSVGWPGVILGLLVGAFLYGWSGQWGSTATEAGLTIDDVRSRHYPWAKVQGISYTVTRLGTNCAVVDATGRLWPMRAPANSPFAPDPEFRRKMTVLEEIWKQHRGSEWRANPFIQEALPVWTRVR